MASNTFKLIDYIIILEIIAHLIPKNLNRPVAFVSIDYDDDASVAATLILPFISKE